MSHAKRQVLTIFAGLVMAMSAFAAQPQAASLTVSGGMLLGATGVVVNAQTYDVTFQDGTCQALFSACDQASDFAFNTLPDAQAAALALMNQVFLDIPPDFFDTQVQLTVGCTAIGGACFIFVPYATDGVTASLGAAKNMSIEPSDGVTTASLAVNADTTIQPDQTWAIFTLAAAVPEPGTIGLTMLGLAALLARRRR
jgi:hypothetical protein